MEMGKQIGMRSTQRGAGVVSGPRAGAGMQLLSAIPSTPQRKGTLSHAPVGLPVPMSAVVRLPVGLTPTVR